MSDIFDQTGTPVPSTDGASAPDYAPFPDHTQVEDKKTYEGDDSTAVREAAEDLSRDRSEGRIPEAESEPIDRGYKYYKGGKAGQDIEKHYTLEAERAARDLNMIREVDAAIQQPTTDHFQPFIDAMRANFPNKELPPDFLAQMDQAQQQVEQAQAQTEQPQAPAEPVDERARLEAAWKNTPVEIQRAIQQEILATEQSRQTYERATWESAQLSAAALFSQFPELSNLSAQELPHAIAAISKVDPAKGQAINAAVQRTQNLYNASMQARQAQSQIEAAKQKMWVDGEDKKFQTEVLANEPPETVEAVARNGARILKSSYGIEPQEFKQMLADNPALRSAPAQRLIYDAIKTALAREEIANKRDRSVPPVQRPGVSTGYRSDSDVEAALKAFNKAPSPQSAAALLTARRAANRR
jgi:hypothetical protein